MWDFSSAASLSLAQTFPNFSGTVNYATGLFIQNHIVYVWWVSSETSEENVSYLYKLILNRLQKKMNEQRCKFLERPLTFPVYISHLWHREAGPWSYHPALWAKCHCCPRRDLSGHMSGAVWSVRGHRHHLEWVSDPLLMQMLWAVQETSRVAVVTMGHCFLVLITSRSYQQLAGS